MIQIEPACRRLVVVLGFAFINFLPLLTETTWVSWMRFRDTSVRSWPGLFLTSVTVTHPNQAMKSRRVIIKAWGAEKRIPTDTISWKNRVSWCLRSATSSMVSWHLAWNFWSAAALKYLQISHVIEANPWCWSPGISPLGEHFREIFRPLMIALSWNTQMSGKMGMKALTRYSLNSTEISVAVLKKGYPQDGSELSLWLFAERNWHRSVCTWNLCPMMNSKNKALVIGETKLSVNSLFSIYHIHSI